MLGIKCTKEEKKKQERELQNAEGQGVQTMTK